MSPIAYIRQWWRADQHHEIAEEGTVRRLRPLRWSWNAGGVLVRSVGGADHRAWAINGCTFTRRGAERKLRQEGSAR